MRFYAPRTSVVMDAASAASTVPSRRWTGSTLPYTTSRVDRWHFMPHHLEVFGKDLQCLCRPVQELGLLNVEVGYGGERKAYATYNISLF